MSHRNIFAPGTLAKSQTVMSDSERLAHTVQPGTARSRLCAPPAPHRLSRPLATARTGTKPTIRKELPGLTHRVCAHTSRAGSLRPPAADGSKSQGPFFDSATSMPSSGSCWGRIMRPFAHQRPPGARVAGKVQVQSRPSRSANGLISQEMSPLALCPSGTAAVAASDVSSCAGVGCSNPWLSLCAASSWRMDRPRQAPGAGASAA